MLATSAAVLAAYSNLVSLGTKMILKRARMKTREKERLLHKRACQGMEVCGRHVYGLTLGDLSPM